VPPAAIRSAEKLGGIVRFLSDFLKYLPLQGESEQVQSIQQQKNRTNTEEPKQPRRLSLQLPVGSKRSSEYSKNDHDPA
jgi:hypothetical protein